MSSSSIIVLGTFDSKGEEHLFLKERIEALGFTAITINVGTKEEPLFKPDFDLHKEIEAGTGRAGRDEAIELVISKGRRLLCRLFDEGRVAGIISAGGGTGTHICTSVMKVLPLGIPKVMVSTVASRDMSSIVSTKDITMMHSVVDLLGINSISGAVLDRAACALCAMARAGWRPGMKRKTIALTMFGFITEGAEYAKKALEALGYEVIAFHANGTGGNAMEDLAAEGRFDGILDLATHEFADELKAGYCRGIGPDRLKPHSGIPRLVVPGGLDCAVLEFTRQNVPEIYADRAIFFYDFRSAVRLSREETRDVALIMAERMNKGPLMTKILFPMKGWSEADRPGGPLHDPSLAAYLLEVLKDALDPGITIRATEKHINDPSFAEEAARLLHEMVRSSGKAAPPP
jgi:uncharacterized protein (UPF0261 family)